MWGCHEDWAFLQTPFSSLEEVPQSGLEPDKYSIFMRLGSKELTSWDGILRYLPEPHQVQLQTSLSLENSNSCAIGTSKGVGYSSFFDAHRSAEEGRRLDPLISEGASAATPAPFLAE